MNKKQPNSNQKSHYQYTNLSKALDENNDDNMTLNETDNSNYDAYNELKMSKIQSNKNNPNVKKNVKFNLEENIIADDENKENDEIEETQNRVVVENALRNKLFNRGSRQKRNKSAETRKK